MRYSAIAPLITGLSDEYESLTAFFNAASVKGVIHPDGSLKHYAPATIERWYRSYKSDGFDALIPSGREDMGKPRKLDHELRSRYAILNPITPACLLLPYTDSFIKMEASKKGMYLNLL